jgi:hypothetical protein
MLILGSDFPTNKEIKALYIIESPAFLPLVWAQLKEMGHLALARRAEGEGTLETQQLNITRLVTGTCMPGHHIQLVANFRCTCEQGWLGIPCAHVSRDAFLVSSSFLSGKFMH